MRLLLASQRFRQKGRFINPLQTLLIGAMPHTHRVQAAVAYVSRSDHAFFAACKKLNLPLEMWSRHDANLATSPEVMAMFLNSKSLDFKGYLIGNFYHPKVIWWHGYGVYIGSANLTNSAWGKNVEAGVLFREDELDTHEMREELVAFFDDLSELGTEITKVILEDAKKQETALGELRRKQYEVDIHFKGLASHKSINHTGLSDFISKRDPDKKLQEFRREWEATLQHLRGLQAIVAAPENQPVWMPKNAPAAIQVDQFLHAVYYNRVRDGISIPYENWFERNKGNITGAVEESAAWWKNTRKEDLQHEYEILTRWVDTQRRLLVQEKVANLNESEFVAAARCIHAINDHAKRRRTSELGEIELSEDEDLLEQRRNRHCEQLFHEINVKGWNPPKLLHHLLFGGPWQTTPDRLFECVHDKDYKIDRLGLSALGEFVGWGLPEHFPPRNDRTNKALRALGYNVHVNSPNKSDHG
jgi:hypothetical protein